MLKKYYGLKYWSVLTIPLTVYLSFNSQGITTFVTLGYVFGFVPLIELVFKPREDNLSATRRRILGNDRFYNWILYLIVPLQWWFIWYFLSTLQEPLTTTTLAGRVTSLGVLCGVFGINVGHELGHRKDNMSQLLAKLLLLSSLYMHFYIEHNRGHHRRVSTEQDPASARYGEHLYQFWLRSMIFSYISAWKLEFKRLRKQGLQPWSPYNEMMSFQLIQLALLLAMGYWFGWFATGLFTAAALMGILLLETVNYIEHYGLTREKSYNGHYEKVQPHHSWNSNHVIGRLMLFELSRHSDHHYKASKKYQLLEHHPHSPQMPTGYPGMMILALCPPLWFGLMHPRMQIRQTHP